MYRGRTVLCTICARGGSKGVANKNVRVLAGSPLICHTVRQAIEAGLFEHVVLSTDADEITRAAVGCGAEAFFRRPADLATDGAAKLPVIRHALEESERHFGTRFEIVVDLDVTSPLRLVSDIVGALDALLDGDFHNIVTGATARRSPYFNLVERQRDGTFQVAKRTDPPLVRRQDSPPCFDMNASIYVWWREVLRANNGLFAGKTGLYVMPEERSIDIDSELDFEIVEFLLARRNAHGVPR